MTGAASPLDTVAAEINARFRKASEIEAKANDHRIAAGLQLIEARKRVDAGEAIDDAGATIGWGKWCAIHIERSQRDVRRVMRIAGAKEPAAALEAERDTAREGMARSRQNRTNVSPVAPAVPEPPPPPAADAVAQQATSPTVRRDRKGDVLDPIPVVLKRAVVRLTKADELDRQIRKKLAEAVLQLTALHVPQGAEEMRQLLKLVDRAEQHRNGVVGGLEAIVADLAPSTPEPALAIVEPAPPPPPPAPPPIVTVRPNGRAPVTGGRADCLLPNGCRYGGCAGLDRCLAVPATRAAVERHEQVLA